MVDVWFMQKEANRMYSAGELPYNFDFEPALILSSPDKEGRFPYWLGFDAQMAIKAFYDNGQIKDPVPSIFVGYDEKILEGQWRLFEWMINTAFMLKRL